MSTSTSISMSVRVGCEHDPNVPVSRFEAIMNGVLRSRERFRTLRQDQREEGLYIFTEVLPMSTTKDCMEALLPLNFSMCSLLTTYWS